MNKQALFKGKVPRNNHWPFDGKEFRKAMYFLSRLKKKFRPYSIKCLYNTQRNQCVSVKKECARKLFSGITKKGIATSKRFWKKFKSFFANEGCLAKIFPQLIIWMNTTLILVKKQVITPNVLKRGCIFEYIFWTTTDKVTKHGQMIDINNGNNFQESFEQLEGLGLSSKFFLI